MSDLVVFPTKWDPFILPARRGIDQRIMADHAIGPLIGQPPKPTQVVNT